jgi:glyoxylase-like metal-dependent hydrolase (beta-lactamase superfamily II)
VETFGDLRVEVIVTSGAWRENCYVLTHLPSGEQAIVDPGGDAERIVAAAGGDVRHLLLTHAHHDHVGAAAAVARAVGRPCRLHRSDERLLRHAPMYALRFAQKRIEPPAPYETFQEPPALPLGPHRIEVLHTPGHTPGSVCYVVGGMALTGDTLLRESVGRTDLPGGDWDTLSHTVGALVERLPAGTVLLPGHGAAWTAGEARGWWPGAAAARPAYRGFADDAAAVQTAGESGR